MNSGLPAHNQSTARDSDEIDLGELFQRIWATRVRVVKVLMVVFALFFVYLTASYLLSSKTVRYSEVFDLTFDGLTKGEFPNGSRFNLSDIISPIVLNRVYKQNQLEEHGLDLDEFRRGVSIEPYTPDYQLIRSKYEDRLADKKRTPDEIADLQKQMTAELAAARSGSVIISLLLPEQRSLTSDLANKVLLDIPKVWAERAINEQGVLKPSLPVYSDRIFNQQRFANLDYLLGMDLVLNSIKLIRSNIANLKDEPNASTLVDDESGFTLVDLDKAIQDVADYDIRQIIDPIKELGITRQPEVVKLFYTRRLADLEQEQELFRKRAQAVRGVLAGYSREATAATGSGVNPAQNNLVPQLGDAFLDRLLEVSRQGTDLEFRQKLTAEVLANENKAIDLQQQINDIKRILAAINGDQEESAKLRSIYVKAVEEQFPVVLASLQEYTRVMNRLYEKQGKQNAGNISELVEPQGGSFEKHAVPLVSSRDIKIFALLVFVFSMGAVFFGMLINSNPSKQK